MYNVNKNDWNSFLGASDKKNYCIIIVEQRTSSGDFLSPELLIQNRDACDRLLQASYIAHRIEIILNRIVCFLNYDQNHFNVSTFATSLYQLLFTIGNNFPSYVFYSEAFLSAEQLEPELTFMFDHAYYGILLGKQHPISSGFLHACHNNTERLKLHDFHIALDELSHHNYEKMVQYLITQSECFKKMFETGTSYSFSEMLQFISEIYYGIRTFFYEKQYHSASLDLPLWDLLMQTDGIIDLLLLLSNSVKEFAALFLEINITEKSTMQMNEILDYTTSHISNVSLSSLSSYFNLTPAYICRIFKQTQNINFTEFVKKKRFELAIETLQTDMNITISELSKQLGYKSQSYFQNTFKNTFGLSPDAYRKQYHKKHCSSDM